LQSTSDPASPKGAQEHHVRGRHAHALTGEIYTYTASYQLLGAMVTWTAQLRGGGRGRSGARSTVGGSIHLRRGQTRGIAPTLITHVVTQAIDTLMGAAAPA
jgi:hypothetical protein